MPIPDDRDMADAERFFETLAGRNDEHAGARRLREAIAAEAAIVREAETAAAPMTAEQRAGMEVVRQRLIAAGVFVEKPAPKPSSPISVAGRLGNWLFGSGMRTMAFAASILLVSLIALRVVMVEPPESMQETYRGAGESVIVAADPQDAAARLTARIEAAGGEVVVVQINATTWAVSVEVENVSRLEDVKQVLRDSGLKTEGQPPYRLEVRSKQP